MKMINIDLLILDHPSFHLHIWLAEKLEFIVIIATVQLSFMLSIPMSSLHLLL